MSRFKAITQITLLQVSLCVTVVMLGLFIGLIPDYREAQMEGRVRLCESLGLNGAVLIGQSDLNRWQAVLEELVARHNDFVSAGIRRKDGRLFLSVGPHQHSWRPPADKYDNENITIPIERRESLWGQMELHFMPLVPTGYLAAFATHPWTRFSLFCGGVCFPVLWLSLRRVLRQFDPTRAAPKNVQSAYDGLAGGLVLMNTQRRIVLCNSAIVETVGIPREKLVGTDLNQIPWIRVSADDEQQPFPWEIASENGKTIQGATLQIDSPLVGLRTLMVNTSPVFGQDGKNGGTLIGFEDITPLEQTKAELEQSKQEAEAANEAKSAFLANMSHEIRTPMNAILGFADIMRRGLDETVEERSEYLSIIHSSGEHLLGLINDILDLSKVESGRMQVESIDCHPHAIVQDVLSIFTVRAREKGLTLSASVRDSIPETITSDPLRLRQILTNLVGNAIKFTESGGIHVEMELRQQANGPQLAFHVADTGIGINQENVERVFQPFSQADSSTTRRFGGTGLGLSISRRLAELMGGELRATSEVGKGSVFTVSIYTGDISQARMLNDDAVRAFVRSSASRHTNRVKLPRCRLLVVDDGESNRQLVRLVMQRAGATIDEACDGLEALKKVGENRYDLIFMDVQMPNMDGTTAATHMRNAGVSIPVIAMTAHAMPEQIEAIKLSGFSHLVTKPVDIDNLLTVAADLLRAAGLEAGDSGVSGTESPDPFDAAMRDETGDATRHDEDHSAANSADRRNAAPFEATPFDLPAKKPKNALESTLPLDDEDFRAIAEEFATRFKERIQGMALLWAAQDFPDLAREAHWLKGAGGTAGFHILTDLGRDLELLSKAEDIGGCEKVLAQLSEQSERIWVQAPIPQPTNRDQLVQQS